MARDQCRWVESPDVPNGRFLVPGCWPRALYGDDADCHCETRVETLQDQIDDLKAQLERLSR